MHQDPPWCAAQRLILTSMRERRVGHRLERGVGAVELLLPATVESGGRE